MKKLRNIILVFLIIVGIGSIAVGLLFNYYSGSVGGSSEKIEVNIENVAGVGISGSKIGEILKEKDLIRSTTFFKIYLKLYGINDLKAGKYELSKDMTLKEIIDIIREGNKFSEDEITLTFQEGINMRRIAKIIASNTNNTEEDVMNLLKDKKYLQGLINEYWFITDDILNDDIYYSLEGYLFPDTYRFTNKDVKVEEIFNKLIKKMDAILTPLKEKIEKSEFSVHEILTLASMAEMEVRNKEDYREKVVSVFVNRLHKKWSLGSDVTTRYSLKKDDHTIPLTKSEYATVNAYNTRSSSMAGKLPVGPIGTISETSILASINYKETNYMYFIANIKTGETFFYEDESGFLKKKNELASVNQGL